MYRHSRIMMIRTESMEKENAERIMTVNEYQYGSNVFQ